MAGIVYPWDLIETSELNKQDWGRNAAHHAASEGAVETLLRLIWDGYDINKRDDVGWTPLMHAVGMNRAWCIKLLLEAKVDTEGVEKVSKHTTEQVSRILKEYGL